LTIKAQTLCDANQEIGATDKCNTGYSHIFSGTYSDKNIALPAAAMNEGAYRTTWKSKTNNTEIDTIVVTNITVKNNVILNPKMMLILDAAKVKVGEIEIGADGQFLVFDSNFEGNKQCIRALGKGKVNITKYDKAGVNGGPLEISGSLVLYHPTNVEGYDVSSVLPFPPCSPICNGVAGCGDKVKEGSEFCDSSETTCSSIDPSLKGTAYCDIDCTKYETSTCQK